MPTRISDKHPVMDSPSSVSLVICHDLRNNFHAAHSGMLLQVVDSAESTTASDGWWRHIGKRQESMPVFPDCSSSYTMFLPGKIFRVYPQDAG